MHATQAQKMIIDTINLIIVSFQSWPYACPTLAFNKLTVNSTIWEMLTLAYFICNFVTNSLIRLKSNLFLV